MTGLLLACRSQIENSGPWDYKQQGIDRFMFFSASMMSTVPGRRRPGRARLSELGSPETVAASRPAVMQGNFGVFLGFSASFRT